MEPIIAEFIKRAKKIEPAYKTIRARSFFANRGSGLSPVATRVDLMPLETDEHESVLWESNLLKIVQSYREFVSISELIESLTSSGFNVDSKYIGFYDSEEPNWYHNVLLRGEVNNGNTVDSTTLQLSAYINIDSAPRSHESHFIDEMKLNPFIPFSSLHNLTRKMIGIECESVIQKRVEIYAPSYLQLKSLRYRGSEMLAEIRCIEDLVPSLRLKAVFSLPNGDFLRHEPRFRKPNYQQQPDGFVEITKSFKVPETAKGAFGVDATISVDADSGFDSIYSPNLGIINPLWSTLKSLEKTEFSIYLETDDFENRLMNTKKAERFENIVAILLESCGLDVAYLAAFSLTCKDLIITNHDSDIALLGECTIGKPRDKFGPMKTAVKALSKTAEWYNFIGVVFTSQRISKADREDASADNVIVKDISDLRQLVEMADNEPNPNRVYEWFGLN